MHKLMCIVLSAVVIAFCRAIRVVCLHDVSMIAIGVEGADQGEEEPSHHHVAPGMSLPHKPSHLLPPRPSPSRAMILALCALHFAAAFLGMTRAQESIISPLVIAPSGKWYVFWGEALRKL
jgi:hypothetical protein